nr:MAG TPA: hypothetical protein [Caudoviricetes sp.]
MTPPPPTADAARAYRAASAATSPVLAQRRNPDARLTAHGQDVDATALVAVVDVLVVKALESVGKRVVRADRARFNALKGRPFHEAHVLWPTDIVTVSKATKGAWDVVPALLDNHGCPGVESGRVVTLLDAYVSQVATHGVPHRLDRLVTALRYVLPENALIRTPSLNRASLEEVR